MGKLIEKVRKNLLNNTSSFKIGFGNRSPFSYSLPNADPNSGVTQIDVPDMDDGTIERMEAEGAMAREMMQQAANIATKAAGSEEKQDERKGKRLASKQTRLKGKIEAGVGSDARQERMQERSDKAGKKITEIEGEEYDAYGNRKGGAKASQAAKDEQARLNMSDAQYQEYLKKKKYI